MEDEFDIVYDQEKDIIRIGEVEFSCEFFRQINSLKVDSIHITSMKVDHDRNLVPLGNGQYLPGRETIRVSIEALANHFKK